MPQYTTNWRSQFPNLLIHIQQILLILLSIIFRLLFRLFLNFLLFLFLLLTFSIICFFHLQKLFPTFSWFICALCYLRLLLRNLFDFLNFDFLFNHLLFLLLLLLFWDLLSLLHLLLLLARFRLF